jgi:hypothetical protein
VVDPGFSDRGMTWRRRGRGRVWKGYPLLSGVRELGLREKFLKISVENLHFKGHVYAVFMYFFKNYFTLYYL